MKKPVQTIYVSMLLSALALVSCKGGEVQVSNVGPQPNKNIQTGSDSSAQKADADLVKNSDLFFVTSKAHINGQSVISGIGFLPWDSNTTNAFSISLNTKVLSAQKLMIQPNGDSLLFVDTNSNTKISTIQMLKTSTLNQTNIFQTDEVLSLALRADGNEIAWTDYKGSVFMLNLQTKEKVKIDTSGLKAIKIQSVPNSTDYFLITGSLNAKNSNLSLVSADGSIKTYNQITSIRDVIPNYSNSALIRTSSADYILNVVSGSLQRVQVGSNMREPKWLDQTHLVFWTTTGSNNPELDIFDVDKLTLTKVVDLYLDKIKNGVVCPAVLHGQIYFASQSEATTQSNIYIATQEGGQWTARLFAASSDSSLSYLCPNSGDL